MSIQAQSYPVFQPAMRIITGITNGFPATVTTSFAHLYATGIIIRLIIPQGFGMYQANHLFGAITVTGSTTFTIALDTTHFDPFVVPETSPNDLQYAQAIPTGEVNTTIYQAYRNVLPYGAI
jgi:hypothetical protein